MRHRLAAAWAMAIVAILFSSSAAAQLTSPDNTMDPFGDNEDTTSWDFSFFESNVWEGNEFWDETQRHFLFDNQGDEPIDEITVIGKRKAAHRLFLIDILGKFDYLALDTDPRQYSDDCQTLMSADPLAMCNMEQKEDQCQTVTITVGPFTSAQAANYNIDLLIHDAAQNASDSIGVGLATGIITGGATVSATTGITVGTLSAIATAVAQLPNRDELNPFREGDSFEVTTTACPTGSGSNPSFNTRVEYTGG